MIYLDASALVTYVLKRPNVIELREFLAAHVQFRGATSTVGFVEAVRNCDRAGSFPNLMAELRRDYDELKVTAQVRDRAADLPGGLKALDAIHLATAELLGNGLVFLVTYDHRLATVARLIDLPVASPGMEA